MDYSGYVRNARERQQRLAGIEVPQGAPDSKERTQQAVKGLLDLIRMGGETAGAVKAFAKAVTAASGSYSAFEKARDGLALMNKTANSGTPFGPAELAQAGRRLAEASQETIDVEHLVHRREDRQAIMRWFEDNPLDHEPTDVKTLVDDKGNTWRIGQRVEFIHGGKHKTGKIVGLPDTEWTAEETSVEVWCEGSSLTLEIDRDGVVQQIQDTPTRGDDRVQGKRSLEL